MIYPSYYTGVSARNFIDDSLWSSVINSAWNDQWNIEMLVRDTVRDYFKTE